MPSAVMAAAGPVDKADLDYATSPTTTTVSSSSSSSSSSSATAAPSGDDIDNPVAAATRLNYTGPPAEINGVPTPTTTLGKLDGLISSPARLSKLRMTNSKKIAAILLETNIVELQRHLLTITVQNQVCCSFCLPFCLLFTFL